MDLQAGRLLGARASRKVRTPQGRVLGNAQAGKPDGRAQQREDRRCGQKPQARVKRCGKSAPAVPVTAPARQAPPGATPDRDDDAARRVPGRRHERPGNGSPRWMAVRDRIRLTGLLRNKPWRQGLFYAGGRTSTVTRLADHHRTRRRGMSPRWEWRTLTEPSDEAERRFDAIAVDTVADSDEQYLLSLDREVSAKIRDGLMDVKVLEQQREDGLQQWRPIMKAEFPISAAEATTLLGALGAGATANGPRTLTLEELLRDVIAPN